MGLHNSSLTIGVALGAPLAGVTMDTFSPAWGFAAVGAVGLLVALLVLPAEARRRRTAADAASLHEDITEADPATVSSAAGPLKALPRAKSG
jgi:MFS family permease